MKKIIISILTLLLFTSAYAEVAMNKADILSQWDKKVVTMVNSGGKMVSFKVSNNEISHIVNKNTPNTNIFFGDNGKLCIEYEQWDDCQWVIKKSGHFGFGGFNHEGDIIILSNYLGEAIRAHKRKQMPIFNEDKKKFEWSLKSLAPIAYIGVLLFLFILIITKFTKLWLKKNLI
ncbi:hypothetical protein MNB_SUP05-9-687 [hydrothermal vent metagenome]|uniref:Uncharacterized protein n=1 Tax=hydrothermal vent metagenome TaxID=652676 RepID=A0A1W1DXX3_9ZZZZ